MEGSGTTTEKDCGVLGGLFQTIINDLRGSSPIWDDFTSKSLKLHTSLKATVLAIGAFLEAFQRVADMATGSKGATKEIGSALTRLCLRHRSIEAHLKTFTSSIVDNLVAPLQDKLEDWKKTVAQIDKDHAKEYKKARQDIKKAASDTVRLQKKAKKGGVSQHGHSKEMQAKLDVSMQEVNAKYTILEDTERSSVRTALIEERSRFCHFIACLKPFVDGELKLLSEISNISEIMQSLCLQASEPTVLPASSEQVIVDLKGLDNSAWNFNQQPSPPSSPSSLGSRKSSMCSINSINSSSSGSSKSHSPSHTMHKRTPSQPQPPGTVRLTSVSSQDSGFTSQDTLFHRPQTPPQSLNLWQTSSTNTESQAEGDCDSTPTTPSDSTPSASSTWNNWPNPPGGPPKMDPSRPHTISSAYEKGHGRPALKPDMFEPPSAGVEMRAKPTRSGSQHSHSSSSVSSNSSSNSHHRPSATISKMQPVLPPHCPKPKIKAVAPPMLPPGAQQPIYANTAQMSQTSPDDGEPTTPTTPAGMTMTQAFPSSPEVSLMALDQAFEQMVGIAGIPEEEEALDDSQEVITPRASTSSSNGTPGTPGRSSQMMAEPLVECHKPKIQADTSLELAKAIRELEASTAALTSAYDEDTYTPPPSAGPATGTMANNSGDGDSYASKSSLPCSSGYGTMTSTPAGSEDTIASGGSQTAIVSKPGESPPLQEEEEDDGEECTFPQEDPFDSDKPYTLPRSSEGSGKFKPYRPPVHPKRPASTTGIPSSSSLTRRSSSANQPKPPPPVRRTASVKSAPQAPPKLRISPQRQLSVGSQPLDRGTQDVGPYAELQLIQQSIQHPQHMPPTAYGHPEDVHHPTDGSQTTSVFQSLNAKFASLNSQYQENVEAGGGPPQGNHHKPNNNNPPAVKQKPKMAIPPPPSVTMTDGVHPQHHPHINNNNNYHQGIASAGGQEYRYSQQQQYQQSQYQPYYPPPQQHQQQQLTHQQHRNLPQQQQQPQLQHQHYHHQHHHHHQQQQQPTALHHHPPGEEDFPLPPTMEELQEMERIYSCPHPPPPPAVAQHPPATKPAQQPPTQQAKPQPPVMPLGDGQHSLMQELKRRVSVDNNSSDA